MHLYVLFVGLVVACSVNSVNSAPVGVKLNDIHDLLQAIPTEDILNIMSDYLAYDREVKQFVVYLHSSEFKDLVRTIDAQPEYIKFLDLLEAAGYQAYKYVNVIHTLLGMPGLDNPAMTSPPPALSGGVTGMIRDLRGLLDQDKVRMLYENKMVASPEFRELVQKFKGKEFQNVLEKMMSLPQIEEFIAKLGLASDE